MKGEFSATLAGRTLTLYSVGFRTDTRISETATVNSGIFRTVEGTRRNFYTLKGRIPFSSFADFAAFINSLAGQSVSFTVADSAISGLVLCSGECTAAENDICEYIIELGVSAVGS